MPTWMRTRPFEPGTEQDELWTCRESGAESLYPVHVTHGKPIDILALKLNMVEDYRGHVDKIRSSREELYGAAELEAIRQCPVCGQGADNLPVILEIYKAEYVQCRECAHYFVKARPTQQALEDFYSQSEYYQATYADPRTTRTRIEQVALPKVEWVTERFRRQYDREPERILDVGAGSGHFVKACRDAGYAADGVEVSKFGREFCQLNFEFELIDKDFIESWEDFKGQYDLVTFWGVIEHVPYPVAMLEAASKVVAGWEAMVVAEVPRWNCFGTAVQGVFLDSIVRHLDPLGHINCFTDTSLATAFRRAPLQPAAAWYFGMDAYELLTQTAYALEDNRALETLKHALPDLQQRLDWAQLSDEIVIAGTPVPEV